VLGEDNADLRCCLSVNEVVGGARVKQREVASAVDVHPELHGVAMARLDACESMNRNGGFGVVRYQIVDFVINHLDGEDMLADCLVAISEEIITTKAVTIFSALSNFGRS
jgi:hypothetical protein